MWYTRYINKAEEESDEMSRILVTLPDALLEDVDEIVATSDYKRSEILVEGVDNCFSQLCLTYLIK